MSAYWDITSCDELPIIDVYVNSISSRLLLDSGSKIDLVSKSFLFDSLGMKAVDIRETDVFIKGVSGTIFPAAGEVYLTFSVVDKVFTCRFIVLHKATFPADLLLSYSSLVKCGFVIDFSSKHVCFSDGAHISLSISDSSHSLKVANLTSDRGMEENENVCVECVVDESGDSCCSDVSSDSCCPQKSTGGETHFSLCTDVHTDVLDECKIVHIISGTEFHKYRITDNDSPRSVDDVFSVVSETDVDSGVNEGNECCFANIDADTEVTLVSMNEDASVKARTVRETCLDPSSFTRVELFCEDADNKELVILNDKFVHIDVEIDNVLTRARQGRFFVYARPNNGKTMNVVPGTTFCDIVILGNKSVTLSHEVFTSLSAEDNLDKELGKTDYPNVRNDLLKLLGKFRDTVALSGDPLGRTNLIEHNVTLEKGTKPFFIPNYRLPIGRREIVDNLVLDMKKQGVIKESRSPYNSPLLLVPKKDGSWRLVIDFRKLNSHTVPDRMPMPILDEVLANLGGAKVFSSIDLVSGYYQVPLDDSSKHLTAFSTHREHLQFEVMPFGLSNAPLTFVRLMQSVLGNMKNVYCYLDDIILFSKSIEDHFALLEQVLVKLKEAGLKISLRKCRFFMHELDFLGHKVSPSGIKMQENKIRAILDYPVPNNVKAVRKFLGIIGYYRAFVRNYATIAHPLTSLLKANVEFHWGVKQEKAFQDLKDRLIRRPILSYPNFEKDFFVACDASDVGLGAVLLQREQNKLMPLSFASRVLTPAERNYSVTERELLAVVWAMRKFRHTILGFPVHVITDHLPVVDLFKKQTFVQNSKFNRWFLSVLEYNPQFKYLPGRYNTIADSLSRVFEEDNIAHKQFVSFQVQTFDLDMDLVREQQHRDSEVVAIVGDLKLCSNTRQNYELIDGLLYLKPLKEGGSARLFVPKSLRENVLKLVHSHKLSGHPGIAKTIRHLSRSFFWPKSSTDVKNFVLNCPTCQLHKGNRNKPAPLEIYPSQLLPFHTVSMDILGPLPATDDGFKFVLVFVDFLSRYTEIVPIKDRTAVSVAEALRHRVITRHSCPRVLISDNAKEFVSEIFKQICAFYDINKCEIVAHKPSSNGLVERTNKKIIEILRTLIKPTTSDWHLILDDIQLTLNNSINDSVGEAPHYLLYGYDYRMPYALTEDTTPPRNTYNYEDYISYRTRRSFDIVKKTREELLKSSNLRKVRYDKDTVNPAIKLGQKVYVVKPFKDGPLFKASPKFEGPYRVVEILKFNKFNLRHIHTGKERIVHWNNLKLIKHDVDVSFLKRGIESNENPVLPQDDGNDVVYRLRNRCVVAKAAGSDDAGRGNRGHFSSGDGSN